MTVEELIGVYIEASNAVVWEAEKRGLCPMTLDMQRAGVTAIVRALRDEIWMRTKRMDACDILLKILGPAEVEGVAKESGGRDRKYGPAQVGGGVPSPTYHISAADWWARFMNARIVVVHGSDAGEKVADTVAQAVEPLEVREVTGASPVRTATDAAPAVCVWRGSKDGQLAYMGCTKRLEWTYDRRKCPSCGKPIAFTEANHG